MKNLFLNRKDTIVFRVGKIVLVNAILLAVLLLLFVPDEKIDDYNLKLILAGAATGQSDSHLLQYSSIFLGRILKIFTTWFHAISWYEVTQYIVLFLSFCVLVYLIQKRKLGLAGNAITLILLTIFGYEAYIDLTFSKTAGIACGAGFFFLFDILYESNLKNGKLNRNIIKLIVAIFLILMGALFRYRIFQLIFGISLAYLMFRFICGCIDLKQGYSQISLKNNIFSIVRTVVICACLFCCLFGVNKAGSLLFSQNEEWKTYQTYNSRKEQLQDYGWPDYETYKDEYEELGIDEVMYNFWSSREYSDPEYFTLDTMRSIIKIKNEEVKVNYIENITSFFKEFPNRFLNEICFWAIIPIIVYWCISKQKYKKATLIISFIFIMLLNFYQFIQGRYDQHQINVGIWFAVVLIYLGCMSEATETIKCNKNAMPAAALFLACFTCVNYAYLASDNYSGSNFNQSVSIDRTKNFLELASNDNEHLYITDYSDRNFGFKGYSVFEQVPEGLYHNIYCTQDYMLPAFNISLDNYGVYNVYQEIVNSDVIYFYQSDYVSTEHINLLESYIQDLYDDTAYSSLVKRLDGISVYGIFSEDFQLDTENIMDIVSGEEDVFSDVNLSITFEELEDEEPDHIITEVSGNIYKKESNSFNNKVFLEICEADGETNYQAVTMYESDYTNDVMNGAYGKVSTTFTTELSDWDPDSTYNIILECDDGMYRIPLEANVA